MNIDRKVLESLLAEGLSGKSIGERLGVASSTVIRRVNELGLEFNGYKSVGFQTRIVTKAEPTRCAGCNKEIAHGAKKCRDCRRIPLDQLKHPEKKLRALMIEKYGHKCQCCGLSLWMDYPIRLELHHRDGDSSHNDWDNLQLLCPNCHSQTWDYGSTMGKASTRRHKRTKEIRKVIKVR